MTLLLLAVLALLAVLLVPGFINLAMELTVYCLRLGDSTWPLWELLGFQFVALTDHDGKTHVAHVFTNGAGSFCQYQDCHGLIKLEPSGTTSDACWSWRPLSKSTAALSGAAGAVMA